MRSNQARSGFFTSLFKNKKFFIYGLFLGAGFNVLVIFILSGVFQLFKYHHLGPFGVLGLFSIWTPLSWLFMLMVYLFLMPVRKVFFYPYVISFIVFNYFIGSTYTGLGLIELKHGYHYYQPITFLVWFALAAWVYIRGEKIKLR